MWAALIPIIAQYGLELAEELFKVWSSGSAPTQADFDRFRPLAALKAVDVMKQRLAAAGIPLDDPHAIALLAQVSGTVQPVSQPQPPV